MPTSVSHKGYEIVPWPETAVSPEMLYLKVDGEVIAAAAATVCGWRILTFDDSVDFQRVDDFGAAMARLSAVGQAAVA